MNRRQFVRNFVGMTAFANCICAEAATMSLCTPAPEFRVPLTQGVWRSQEFRVNKRYYNMWLWLKMDGRMPLEEVECQLGRPRGHSCETSPLLDLEWKIWDRGTLVNSWAE